MGSRKGGLSKSPLKDKVRDKGKGEFGRGQAYASCWRETWKRQRNFSSSEAGFVGQPQGYCNRDLPGGPAEKKIERDEPLLVFAF